MSIREIREGVFEVKVYRRVERRGTKPKPMIRHVQGEDEALAVEAELYRLRDLSTEVDNRTTVREYADIWLAGKATEDLAHQTIANYRGSLDRYILPELGDVRLLSLQASDIRRAYGVLKKRGLSGTTRLTAHRALRAMLNTAASDHLLRHNPIDGVKAPSDDTAEKEALSPGEVAEFLGRLEGTAVFAPAVVMFAAGLRRQEVLALRWESVDLEAGTIVVCRALEQVGTAVAVKQPKSKRSARTVPIGEDVVAVLREHRAAQDALRARLANKWADDAGGPLVFPSGTYTDEKHRPGRLWTPTAFTNAWCKVTHGTKWAHVTPHVCRHTYITSLFEAGYRLELVSRQAGHSSSGVTLRKYSHLFDGERGVVSVPKPKRPTRIVAAQPLVPDEHGGQLEPTPILSPAEAEVEAAAFAADPAAFTLEALEDVPAEFLSRPVERMLAAGELQLYTHVLHVVHAPEHTCRDYLVRVE